MKLRTNKANYSIPCPACGKSIARGEDYLQGGPKITFVYSETASATGNKFHITCAKGN